MGLRDHVVGVIGESGEFKRVGTVVGPLEETGVWEDGAKSFRVGVPAGLLVWIAVLQADKLIQIINIHKQFGFKSECCE